MLLKDILFVLSRKSPLLAYIHHAEAIAFRVGQDNVVGVRWTFVPVHLSSAQGQQAGHFSGLVLV